MPKLKTKSAAKKRFKITASGKVKFKQAFARHMMINKSKKQKRNARGTDVMFAADGEKVLNFFMPYAKKRRKRAVAKLAQKTEA